MGPALDMLVEIKQNKLTINKGILLTDVTGYYITDALCKITHFASCWVICACQFWALYLN